MRLKICGINDAAFARAAERLGADYLGLIFAEGSPRRVTPDQARTILAGLSGRAKPVGVFTTTSVEEIVVMARSLGLQTLQLHRRATADDIAYLKSRGFTVWALAGSAADPGRARCPHRVDALLFDSSHGDGETVLRKGPYQTILAGGISRENLPAALASGADILDVSSSLESSPGVKSLAKLEAFMADLHTSDCAIIDESK